jgi:hypothetical protein
MLKPNGYDSTKIERYRRSHSHQYSAGNGRNAGYLDPCWNQQLHQRLRLYIYAIDSNQITMVIDCLLIDCTEGGLKTRVSAYRDWIDRAN